MEIKEIRIEEKNIINMYRRLNKITGSLNYRPPQKKKDAPLNPGPNNMMKLHFWDKEKLKKQHENS